jgi:predicted Zn-dependent protease
VNVIKLLLLTLLLTGCSPIPNSNNPRWYHFPIGIGFNNNVSAAFKTATLSAIDEWENETGIDLFDTTQGPIFVSVMFDSPNHFKANEQASTNIQWSGEYLFSATIRINTSMPCDTKSLMLHELGHALGLKHTSQGVMYPYLGYYEVRDILDIETIDYFYNLYY